jgi:hypothetical protein
MVASKPARGSALTRMFQADGRMIRDQYSIMSGTLDPPIPYDGSRNHLNN